MFVCLCNAVTDHEIREHARRGVESLEELRMRTGCADCCGQCAEEAESVLLSQQFSNPISLPVLDLAQPA